MTKPKKKRVMLTLEVAPYEELQALGKEIGLHKTWFAGEVDILVKGLRTILFEVKAAAERNEKMTEDQCKALIVKTAEGLTGQKLRDLIK